LFYLKLPKFNFLGNTDSPIRSRAGKKNKIESDVVQLLQSMQKQIKSLEMSRSNTSNNTSSNTNMAVSQQQNILQSPSMVQEQLWQPYQSVNVNNSTTSSLNQGQPLMSNGYYNMMNPQAFIPVQLPALMNMPVNQQFQFAAAAQLNANTNMNYGLGHHQFPLPAQQYGLQMWPTVAQSHPGAMAVPMPVWQMNQNTQLGPNSPGTNSSSIVVVPQPSGPTLFQWNGQQMWR
jgi:hypothetical protein